jgi:hypothetical protein
LALPTMLILALALTEIWARFYVDKEAVDLHEDERNLTYRYDERLGWFPIENSKRLFKGTRTITVEHNQRGFRDIEHVFDERPRIVFVGDSAVWGYDVEGNERFTERLREKLPAWSVYNLGVSGYGTDQEYLLLEQIHDTYSPNIVFVLTGNDERDNTHNCMYGGYYKPYFVIHDTVMELRGVPVPKSENFFFANHRTLARSYVFRLLAKRYFQATAPPVVKVDDPSHAILLNLKQLVEGRGSRLLVGLVKRSPDLEAFLADSKIPFVQLDNPHRYPADPPGSGHWTPEGHTLVSQRIYDFLISGGYLKLVDKHD